jgi:hypothetical protein
MASKAKVTKKASPKQIRAAKKNLAKAHAKPKTAAQRLAAQKNFAKARQENKRLSSKSAKQSLALLRRTKDPAKALKYLKAAHRKKGKIAAPASKSKAKKR